MSLSPYNIATIFKGNAMAAGQNQRNRKNDPMVTKTGKPRLGPLNLAQLTKLLDSATAPKKKDKIRKELFRRFPNGLVITPEVAATV
ncbi:MAG: hypothetical protein EBQ70_09385 [Betaproteobacteria bacterium]|nr:hypothetical protein [Betaproteobacteria bacterium]